MLLCCFGNLCLHSKRTCVFDHLHALHYHLILTQPQPTMFIGGDKVGTLYLSYQQTGFMNADRQYEQEAHDRTEVAVAAATAHTPADIVYYLSRIEPVSENTFSNQQMEILSQMNTEVCSYCYCGRTAKHTHTHTLFTQIIGSP